MPPEATTNGDIRLLDDLCNELSAQSNLDSLHEKIVDAATVIMRSDFASMQMLYPERGNGGELYLMAYRGFKPEAAIYWRWVGIDESHGSTCGKALREKKRVIAADIEQCDYIQNTKDLATYRNTGIAACQTTPLFSHAGDLIGMISTHWKKPFQPSETMLHLFDILAAQASTLIELKQAQVKTAA